MENIITPANPAKNPNAPAQIKKRIASLRKELSKKKRIERLLREEQRIKDQIKGGW